MPLIEAVGLSRIYTMGGHEVRALDGVDFSIETGEYVAVMGPSGSGKSTLMHILGCLDRPTGGDYRLDGTSTRKLSDDRLADLRSRSIGFVFQDFNLLNRMTAMENVELPLIYAGVRRSERRRRAKAALERVGLGDRLDHRPQQMSGGQRQRVAIARALINEPRLILADEPTGNLDSKTGDEILALFDELVAQGHTLIVVTHGIEVGERAKRIIALRDGRIERDTAESPPAAPDAAKAAAHGGSESAGDSGEAAGRRETS